LSDSKHKSREGGTYIQSRKYDVTNYTAEDDIPLKNCSFVVTGFEAGNKNGIKEHFHFRYHYKLKRGEVFIRRVACMCEGCHQQILKGWDKTIQNSKDQPMFQKPTLL
jgi:hypothetical protein